MGVQKTLLHQNEDEDECNEDSSSYLLVWFCEEQQEHFPLTQALNPHGITITTLMNNVPIHSLYLNHHPFSERRGLYVMLLMGLIIYKPLCSRFLLPCGGESLSGAITSPQRYIKLCHEIFYCFTSE